MKILFFVCFLLLLPFVSWGQIKSPSVVMLYTKTGDDTEKFENLLDVSRFALDEYNQIHHKRLNFNFTEIDDKGNASIAETSLKSVVEAEKPIAIIGPLYSNIALSLKDFVNLNKIPMISVFATHNDLTKNSEWIYRICGSNHRMVKNLVGYLSPLIRKNKLNISVFKDLSDAYSTDLADSLKREIEQRGIDTTISEVVFRGVHGLDSLKDIDSKVWSPTKKDVLFLATQDNISGKILTAMESEPFLVAAIEPVNFIEIIQKIKKNKMHMKLASTAQWVPGKSRLSRKIETAFKAKFKHDLQISAALTFDAVWSLAQSYSHSQEDGISLQKALHSQTPFYGLSGNIAFGPKGERITTESFVKEDILE